MHKRLVPGLLLLGAIDSIYILLSKYNCPSCTIHNTVFGQPGGIPVALFGLMGYLLIYLCHLKQKGTLYFALITGGIIVSMGLFSAQVIFGEYCFPCLLSAAIMTILWIAAIKNIFPNLVPVAGALLMLFIAATIIYNSGLFIAPVKTGQAESMEKVKPLPKTLKVYNYSGQEKIIDLTKKEILFISSWCPGCDRALKEINPNSKPIIIDTFINTDFDTEKNLLADKLSPFRIDERTVYFDLDNINPVDGVPAVIKQ